MKYLAPFKVFQAYSKAVWMLFISRMLVVGSFSLSMMFFSIYLHTELHISLRRVGFIMMIAAAISAFSMIIGGTLSDRFGRRPLMLAASALRAVVFFCIAVVMQRAPHVIVLTVLYMFARICGGLYLPACDAMLADIVTPRYRTKAYGIMRIFANAGFAIGPAIGGIVADISYTYLFLLSAIASVVSSVFILIYVRESLSPAPNKSEFFRSRQPIPHDPRLLLFCMVSFLFFLVMGQFGVTLSLYSTQHIGITNAQLGRLFTTNGVMVILLQYPISLLIDRIKGLRNLQIGMIIYTLGFFAFGFAGSFGFLVMCVIVFTVGEMIFEPSANAIVANMAPLHAKGQYLGMFGLTRSFGWSIAPFIGGLLLHSFLHQGQILWGIIAIIGCIALIGYIILDKTLFKELQ